MLIVYLISILAGILMGITESLNKNIAEKKYSAFSYFFVQVFINLLLFTVPFLISKPVIMQPIAYLYIVILAIFLFLGNIFIIKAYKTEDISNLTILSRSSLVIAFFSGIFLLSENITRLKLIGILLILLGILVIFYEGKKLSPSTGFLFALFGGILAGVAVYLRKISLLYFNPISSIYFVQIIILALLLFIPKTYRDIKPILIKYKKKIFLSRLTVVAGIYLYIWALSKGNISITNTNYETAFLLSTSFIGIWILGEKKRIAKKLAGSLLCIFGIILLNFF